MGLRGSVRTVRDCLIQDKSEDKPIYCSNKRFSLPSVRVRICLNVPTHNLTVFIWSILPILHRRYILHLQIFSFIDIDYGTVSIIGHKQC